MPYIKGVIYAWNKLSVRNDLRGSFDQEIGPFELTVEIADQISTAIQKHHTSGVEAKCLSVEGWWEWYIWSPLDEPTRLRIHKALKEEFPKILWWGWWGKKSINLLADARAHNEYVQEKTEFE